jgi:ATP-dependent exoDNAse (exonuclease V) alpha subunit
MGFQDILQSISVGKNLFFHGPGGTGKTFTVRKLHTSYGSIKSIIVAAPTGRAAVNIDLNAQTINRVFGIPPLRQDMSDNELNALAKKCAAKKKDLHIDLLIIDEISMVGRQLFTIMDKILQLLRGNALPMGGTQLIVLGDFYQLPPVKDGKCFCADVWPLLKFEVVIFDTPWRYDNPETYEFLKNLRVNKLTDSDRELIESRRKAYIAKEYRELPIIPVLLYATNNDADRFNDKKLGQIGAPVLSHTAIDKKYVKTPREFDGVVRSVLEDLAPKQVDVKVGAKVMICKNIDPDNKLVNGMMGMVTEIEGSVVTIQIEDGTSHNISPCIFEAVTKNYTCSRIQYPFRLAWAITIHKSQGATLSSAVIKIEDIRNPGQVYVALSRVRDIRKIYIMGNIDYSRFIAANELPPELEE